MVVGSSLIGMDSLFTVVVSSSAIVRSSSRDLRSLVAIIGFSFVVVDFSSLVVRVKSPEISNATLLKKPEIAMVFCARQRSPFVLAIDVFTAGGMEGLERGKIWIPKFCCMGFGAVCMRTTVPNVGRTNLCRRFVVYKHGHPRFFISETIKLY